MKNKKIKFDNSGFIPLLVTVVLIVVIVVILVFLRVAHQHKF
jgi:hypothetical protein